MKIHIVGSGPTGMSLAWEILRSGEHDVTIYDRKVSAGGSWWEPEVETRDLHAHRIVFDRAFVNTQSLFSEMNIRWDDIFKAKENGEHINFVLRSLGLKDYGTLISLFARVLAQPKKYKTISMKDATGILSESGQKCIEHLPLIMDGVTWDVMTAYEFVKNLDHVALSTPYTQRVSGKVMCDAMEEALINAGANFIFGTELMNVEYGEDDFVATFSDERIVDDGMLFLCLDNSPAIKLLGDNWGPDALKKVQESTYGAINVLIDYEEAPEIKTDLEIAVQTKWNLQPKVLSDGKTISCVICDLSKEILSSSPEIIKAEVIKQLDLPEPVDMRIGWGAEWEVEKEMWTFSQSSGVLSLHGQLPFFGKCPKVAMCGMMSPRETPYSSIEAGIEVSRALSHECFGTREPLKPLLLTQVLLLIVVLLIVLVLVYRNRHS
jgi:hypothetical protein